MGIEITGLDAFERKLINIAQRMPEERDRFLKQEGELIRGRAAMNTPIGKKKGGRLRAGWRRSNPIGGVVEIYNNTDYAAHVEYGHRLKNRKTGEWLKDSSGKLKFVEGSHMLQEAMDETKLKLRSDAKQILGRLLR